jgi:hypothetical protein
MPLGVVQVDDAAVGEASESDRKNVFRIETKVRHAPSMTTLPLLDARTLVAMSTVLLYLSLSLSVCISMRACVACRPVPGCSKQIVRSIWSFG